MIMTKAYANVSFEKWPQLRCLNWFGLWPRTGLHGVLDRFICYTLLLYSPTLFLAEGFEFRRLLLNGEIAGAMMPMNELLSGLLFYISAIVFSLYGPLISKTIQSVDDLNEKIISEVGELAAKEISTRRAFGHKVYKIFITAYFIIILSWSSSPLVKRFLFHDRTSLILHSWLPFESDSVLGFLGNFVFQALSPYYYSISECMFYSLFASICEFIFGHFRILSHRLENVKYGMQNTKYELIKCIRHYSEIIRIVKMFQEFTTSFLMTACTFTVLLLCVMLFELTTGKPSMHRFVNVIIEAEFVLVFLGLFCWYGNEITHQNAELIKPGFMGDWYNGTKEEKLLLLNIMTRTLPSMYFGGFIKINMLTFINILKGGFSYYNFISGVHTSSSPSTT